MHLHSGHLTEERVVYMGTKRKAFTGGVSSDAE